MSEQATQQQPSPEEPSQEAKQEQRQQAGGRERERGRRRRHGQQPPQQQSAQAARRPDPSLNMDELRDLVQLIAEHGFTDFELEREGFRVRLKRDLTPQIINAPLPPPRPDALADAARPCLAWKKSPRQLWKRPWRLKPACPRAVLPSFAAASLARPAH